MGLTLDAFDLWHKGLALSDADRVLVESGRVLAAEVDEAGSLGRSAASSVSQLRAVMAQLGQKVTADADRDDWSAPVLTAVRNSA